MISINNTDVYIFCNILSIKSHHFFLIFDKFTQDKEKLISSQSHLLSASLCYKQYG